MYVYRRGVDITGHWPLVTWSGPPSSSPLVQGCCHCLTVRGSRLLSSGPQPSGENLECLGLAAPLHYTTGYWLLARCWLEMPGSYPQLVPSMVPRVGSLHVCHVSRVTWLTVTCDAAAAVSPYRLVVVVPAWQVQALVTRPGARTTLHTCPGGRKYFLGLVYIFITHGGAANSNAFRTALH